MGMGQGVGCPTETGLELGANWVSRNTTRAWMGGGGEVDTRQVAATILETRGLVEKGRQTDIRAPPPATCILQACEYLDTQPDLLERMLCGSVPLLWGSIKQRGLVWIVRNSLRNTARTASLPAPGTFRRHMTQYPPSCKYSSDCQPARSRHLPETWP